MRTKNTRQENKKERKPNQHNTTPHYKTTPHTTHYTTYRISKRVEEASTNGGPDILNGYFEASGGALPFGVRGQGEVRLGHADWKVVEALNGWLS